MKGFVAYPSRLPEVVQTLSALPEAILKRTSSLTLKTWQANDIPGYCLIDPIVSEIEKSDFIIADVTIANFNVFYEIGYAIGKGKRVILLRNSSVKGGESLMREVGVLETLGYATYTNHGDLCPTILAIHSTKPLKIPEVPRNRSQPLFICMPKDKTEAEIRIISRIKKKARIGFRNFDPTEHIRLSPSTAIEQISTSHGIILPLISSNRTDHEPHNLRCSFLAGMAHALNIETLILQSGAEPVPLDYADAVAYYGPLENIDKHINEFAPRVTESLQQVAQANFPELITPVQRLHLGASAAENEHNELGNYYIKTEEYQRVIRGEVQLVTGRKGSGKTALFYQVRNKVRSNKHNIVLDLNPEGFQLSKFKSVILERLDEGTQEHTITAFWEYLILLELCYKLLEKDRIRHLHDHTLRDKYINLMSLYKDDPLVIEGDFAERLLLLIDSIEDRFSSVIPDDRDNALLGREQITQILYKHDIAKLRNSVLDYLSHKDEVWILFDNIDKGWTAKGVSLTDLLNLRCLIECIRKLARDFKRKSIILNGIVFIRNDVYDVLLESTPDRGKLSRANMDWTDADLMRELLRRRFISSIQVSSPSQTDPKEIDFETLWGGASITHLKSGEETSQYIIDRSLMRPRCLLDLLLQCKSHAVNLGHSKITDDDFLKGESAYSSDLVHYICLEIHDILPEIPDSLYVFLGCSKWLGNSELMNKLTSLGAEENEVEQLRHLLLWYGVIGIVRTATADETYIYNVNYPPSFNKKALLALVNALAAAFCKDRALFPHFAISLPKGHQK